MSSRLLLLLILINVLSLSACGGPATDTPLPQPQLTSAQSQSTPRPVNTVSTQPAPLTAITMPAVKNRVAAFSERMDERRHLVETAIVTRDIENPAVVEAMLTVPRHAFVPAEFRPNAYRDQPLPIGYGQTISQPYVVALMTQMVQPEPDDVVLEVGAGSGYQAAVLAEMVSQVYTIEIVGALAERVKNTVYELGYDNISVKHADGYFGWEEHAPFDAIVVTAAPDHVPPPLKDQLADGGRMILPVGPPGGYQELWLVERDSDQFTTTSLGGVRFVPLTRNVRED